MRCRDLNKPMEPIAGSLPPDAWLANWTPTADDVADAGAGIREQGDTGVISVVAGGEPRGGMDPPIVVPGGRNGLNARLAPEMPMNIPAGLEPEFARQKALVVRTLLTDRNNHLNALNLKVANPALVPQDIKTLRTEIDQVSAEVRMLTEELNI